MKTWDCPCSAASRCAEVPFFQLGSLPKQGGALVVATPPSLQRLLAAFIGCPLRFFSSSFALCIHESGGE